MPWGRRYARPLWISANTPKMASMTTVESVDRRCSWSRKSFAYPEPGASHTCNAGLSPRRSAYRLLIAPRKRQGQRRLPSKKYPC